MDEVIISNGDSPLISQPSPVLVGGEPSVVVQENFVGGQNSTIEIGSVETLPEGSQAYVNNVGTPTHAILDFGIVTGNTGESGSDGSDGTDGQAATIQVGTVTTGLPDTNVIITNVGTENAAILDFTIPRGSQGEQGIQGVAGVDGISPRAYVEQITGGARVVIEDSETTTTADIMDGTDGTDGTDGFSPIATVTPTAAGATISITDSQGTTTANITNGIDGTDGTDGFSPIATVTPTASGATISITDSQGTTTANITNGSDGTDGTSATVTVGSTTTGNAGTNASVTNSGTSSAAVLDFVIPRGADGTNGTNGTDGFSPIATVTQNTGSATISITDANGTTTATVYDGVTPDTTVTSYSITGTPAHSAGTNSYDLKKQLNHVTLNCSVIWLNSITADTWTNLGTIPVAIRPSKALYCAGVAVKSNGSLLGYCRVEVDTDGTVNMKCSGANNALSGVSFTLSWFK